MKIGLVLEGGGMRGLFSAGVLDALLELKELSVNGIVGVSSGALFGVNYVSKQKERAVRYNKKYADDKRYMGLHSWITTGNAVNKDFAFYELPYKLDVFDNETFKKAETDFYVVMKIIEINGKKYLDGGISDSIPIDFCESLGYDKIIAVLTRPEGTYKEDKLGFLYKLVYRKYPNLVNSLLNMATDYEKVLAKIKDLENKGKIFVVRPPEVLKIGRLEKNRDKIQKVYDTGLNTGLKELNNIVKYLNK